MAPRPLPQSSLSASPAPTIAHYNGTLQWHRVHSPKVGCHPPPPTIAHYNIAKAEMDMKYLPMGLAKRKWVLASKQASKGARRLLSEFMNNFPDVSQMYYFPTHFVHPINWFLCTMATTV